MQTQQRTNLQPFKAKHMVTGILALLLISLVAVSCEQDAYDKGEGAFSYTQADFCEAYTNSNGVVEYVVTDDDEQLRLATPFTAKSMATPDSVYRTILYYNKVKQGSAELVNIGLVPVVGVASADKFEDLRTDPIKLESAWMSKNGKYLNLAIWLKTGTMNESAEKQSLGMVCTDTLHNDNGTTTLRLRLHHGQGDVPEYYSTKYYLSIPASEILADSIYLSVNTYDGDTEKRLRIK